MLHSFFKLTLIQSVAIIPRSRIIPFQYCCLFLIICIANGCQPEKPQVTRTFERSGSIVKNLNTTLKAIGTDTTNKSIWFFDRSTSTLFTLDTLGEFRPRFEIEQETSNKYASIRIFNFGHDHLFNRSYRDAITPSGEGFYHFNDTSGESRKLSFAKPLSIYTQTISKEGIYLSDQNRIEGTRNQSERSYHFVHKTGKITTYNLPALSYRELLLGTKLVLVTEVNSAKRGERIVKCIVIDSGRGYKEIETPYSPTTFNSIQSLISMHDTTKCVLEVAEQTFFLLDTNQKTLNEFEFPDSTTLLVPINERSLLLFRSAGIDPLNPRQSHAGIFDTKTKLFTRIENFYDRSIFATSLSKNLCVIQVVGKVTAFSQTYLLDFEKRQMLSELKVENPAAIRFVVQRLQSNPLLNLPSGITVLSHSSEVFRISYIDLLKGTIEYIGSSPNPPVHFGSGKVLINDHGFFIWNYLTGTKVPHKMNLKGQLVQFGDGFHGLLAADQSYSYKTIDLRGNVNAPKIRLGSAALRQNKTISQEIEFDPYSTDRLDFTLDNEWKDILNDEIEKEVGAEFKFYLTQELDTVLAWQTVRLTRSGENFAALTADRNKRYSYSYEKTFDFHCVYTDAHGCEMTWVWRNMYATNPKPLLSQGWFRSSLAFIFICLTALIGSRVLNSFYALLVLVGSISFIIIVSVSVKYLELDLFFLAIYLSVAFALGSISGMISPIVFRELERYEPFRSLSPALISIPAVNRRLFKNYVNRVAQRLSRDRIKANEEVFCELGVRIRDKQGTNSRFTSPVKDIVKVLTDFDPPNRAHVLVEGTGGRGKSALLRAVVGKALENYGQDTDTPLPIFCDGEKNSIYEFIAQGLGSDGFSNETIKALAKAGRFFLVIDGITESSIKPKEVGEFISKINFNVYTLITSRPDDQFRRSINQAASRYAVLEPDLLTDESLPKFVSVYSKGIANFHFSETAKTLCKSDEGNYIPILVRLTIKVLSLGEVKTVRDIYHGTIHHLLPEADDIDKTIELCQDTYWKTGKRRLQYAAAPRNQRNILEILMKSGLVVSAEFNLVEQDNPITVKFFHDSIQSFLTALGLMGNNDLWKSYLKQAAGNPRFDSDRSGITELFLMCVDVYLTPKEMKDHLFDSLKLIANENAGAFSRDWVVSAANVKSLAELIDNKTPGSDALVIAATECNRSPNIHVLARLYAKVITLISREEISIENQK